MNWFLNDLDVEYKGKKTDQMCTKVVSWTTRWMHYYQLRWGRLGVDKIWGEGQHLSLRHATFEKSTKRLDRDVEEAVRYIRIGFGWEVFAIRHK